MPDSPSLPARPRVRLLVSVRDAAEAALARARGADLVDAKDPDRGALGGLPAATVRAIVAASPGGLTSAVAGEPRDAAEAARMLAELRGTGVDYLKIARPAACRGLALPRGAPVIAVLFAEDPIGAGDPAALARAGFRGAMIDTRGKDGRRLTDHPPLPRLAAFLAECRRHGLLSGLAGSLALDDVPALASLGPDYLGFRGGLCGGGDRRGALDPARIAEAARRLAAAAARPAAA
ncbi:(5-formylfuran-3-yl)methyl phosphate synthase [Methylobacterium sp. WSM2598]|uniref:(5-formylfuran-3-yl)methyl phosphate synthase n=1 Tax=Methylobacterium sp. WSM2598 TaxID=398261 RepID=UPI0004760F0C|nr:(5-formylfuran-3-yl)methyl phosphate synthase [Methylobacterium sp. WSM2598]